MKTIRFRGRAMIVLCVCSFFALVFVVKTASDAYSISQVPTKLERNHKVVERQAPSPSRQLSANKKVDQGIKDMDKFRVDRKRGTPKEPKNVPLVPRLVTHPPPIDPRDKAHIQKESDNIAKPSSKVIPNEPAKNRPLVSDIKPRKRRPHVSEAPYPVLKRGKFIPGNRVFHFDLKGAAPKVPYFRQVFHFIKTLGATGVLLEWEDMFPYSGTLSVVKNSFAYTMGEIRQILQYAKEAQLDIIPLVQTFGHLEWILKHERFAHLRQVDRYPQVICLGDDEAVNLVKMALDQVLTIHKEFPMPYFHIGADEAFQVGMCKADQEMMQKEHDSREKLMLRHIGIIAQHVKKIIPTTNVLMWHDMLNNVENTLMKEYKLGELIEPVVWNYAENLEDQLYPDMWNRFSEVFPNIWGASAYKGADGPSRYYSNVPHYLQNHVSWIDQMTTNYKSFKRFRGLILTGWQRFDHFAVLCEILPVGLPSAAVNLMALERGQYDRSLLTQVSKLMDCSSTIDIESIGVAGYCNFPGFKVYQAVQQLRTTIAGVEQNVLNDYQVHGWLSEFNMRHNYSNAWYLDQILEKVQMSIADLESVVQNLRTEMASIFFGDTIDEFIFEYVEPHLNKLKEMESSAKRIGAIKTFPGRPFKIQGKLSTWSSSQEADSKAQNRKKWSGNNPRSAANNAL